MDKVPRVKYLGKQLSAKMGEKGLTAYKLSLMTGVKQVTIRKYASGEGRKADAFTLAKLAQALGVSVDYLVGTHEPDVEGTPAGVALAAN